MAEQGPKLTVAGYGLDISWKLWALIIILALVFFALVAGIKVNIRNAEWFRRIHNKQYIEPVEETRRFFPILKEQVEVEL